MTTRRSHRVAATIVAGAVGALALVAPPAGAATGDVLDCKPSLSVPAFAYCVKKATDYCNGKIDWNEYWSGGNVGGKGTCLRPGPSRGLDLRLR
jgi:hypothetical protein